MRAVVTGGMVAMADASLGETGRGNLPGLCLFGNLSAGSRSVNVTAAPVVGPAACRFILEFPLESLP